jgi:hypothetical protein
MLYISTTKGSFETDFRKIGHIADNMEGDVVALGATDDDLNYIDARFTNIPMPINKRMVHWFGDMASFIVHNM